MRIWAVLLTFSVASSKSVARTDDTPIVAENPYPDGPWEVFDLMVGFTAGMYAPLVAYARDDDCFSSWFGWGVGVMEMSNLF